MQFTEQGRVVGPEKSMPYTFFQKKSDSFTSVCKEQRLDGRSPVNLQKMFMAVDVVSQASGSSFVEVGNTKVVCSVYGPREVQRASDFKLTGQVSCEVKFAPFSSRVRKPPQPDRLQKEMSRQLKEALESVIILDKFPKTQISVYISVVENSGSLFSACLTAAGLALGHSNIDIYDVVVGADLLWSDGLSYVNPTQEEEESMSISRLQGQMGCGSLTLGMMPKYAKGQITLLIHEGELEEDTLTDGVNLAIEACQTLYKLAKQVQHLMPYTFIFQAMAATQWKVRKRPKNNKGPKERHINKKKSRSRKAKGKLRFESLAVWRV